MIRANSDSPLWSARGEIGEDLNAGCLVTTLPEFFLGGIKYLLCALALVLFPHRVATHPAHPRKDRSLLTRMTPQR